MRVRWTLLEDEMVAAYYRDRGPSWEGWSDVLPNRTYASIKERARRLGLHKTDSASAMDDMVPDPHEDEVFELMAEGLAPSEIDEVKRWPRGTTVAITVSRWRRLMLVGGRVRGDEEVCHEADRVQP